MSTEPTSAPLLVMSETRSKRWFRPSLVVIVSPLRMATTVSVLTWGFGRLTEMRKMELVPVKVLLNA